jgi:hypothetical protein
VLGEVLELDCICAGVRGEFDRGYTIFKISVVRADLGDNKTNNKLLNGLKLRDLGFPFDE